MAHPPPSATLLSDLLLGDGSPALTTSAPALTSSYDPRALGAQCDVCLLSQCRWGHPVGPEINHGAKVGIVGEGPGADEVERGLPFVGASGRELNRALSSVGVDRRRTSVFNAFACFPAGVEVSSGPVQVAYRRVYEGPMVRVQTVQGRQLTGTPNHPALTSKGRVSLGSLRKGDSVLCSRASEGLRGVSPHVENGPASIDQVFCAALQSPSGVQHRMVGRPMDFHGDGTESDVDVVRIDLLLRDELSAKLCEEAPHLQLADADDGFGTLAPGGAALKALSPQLGCREEEGAPLSVGDAARSFSESAASVGAGCLQAHDHRFASVSKGYALSSESPSERAGADAVALRQGLQPLSAQVGVEDGRICDVVSNLDPAASNSFSLGTLRDSREREGFSEPRHTDVELAGELLQRLPGDVTTDEVLSVEVFWFRGHVYNLETTVGWYVAAGIVVGNCRPPDNKLDRIERQIAKLNKETAREVKDGETAAEEATFWIHPVDACRPRLLRELQTAGITDIIPVGAAALRSFTHEKRSILDIRGGMMDGWMAAMRGPNAEPQFVEAQGAYATMAPMPGAYRTRILPTIHPAFVLRARRWTRVFQSDLNRGFRWFAGLVEYTPPIIHGGAGSANPTPSADWLYAWLRARDMAGWDTETDGLEPLLAKLRCVSLASYALDANGVPTLGGREAVVLPFLSKVAPFPRFYPQVEENRIRDVLAWWLSKESGRIKLGWNTLQYDAPVMWSNMRIWPDVDSSIDGLTLHRDVDPELPHGLGFVVSLIGKMSPAWKAARTATTAEDDPKLHRYAALDADHTFDVVPKLVASVKERNQQRVYSFDRKMAGIVAPGLHRIGLRIDITRRDQHERMLLYGGADPFDVEALAEWEAQGRPAGAWKWLGPSWQPWPRKMKGCPVKLVEAADKTMQPRLHIRRGARYGTNAFPSYLKELQLYSGRSDKDPRGQFNPASVHQVRDLIYDQWNLPIPNGMNGKPKMTKGGDPSTDDEAIRALLTSPLVGGKCECFKEYETNPWKWCAVCRPGKFLNALRRYRESMKLWGTYLKRLVPMAHVFDPDEFDFENVAAVRGSGESEDAALDSLNREDVDEFEEVERAAAEMKKQREKVKGYLWPDGCIRPSYNAHGTLVGRLSANAPNCFDGDTEVLTPKGWVAFKDLKDGERVAQYTESGRVEMVTPIGGVIRRHYQGRMVHHHNEHIDLLTTPDHRCLLRTRRGKLVVVTADELPWDRQQIHAGQWHNSTSLALSDAEIMFLCALQADGAWTANAAGLDFAFAKVRKIERLREILTACSAVWSEALRDKNNAKWAPQTRFYLGRAANARLFELADRYLGPQKLFGAWVLEMDARQLALFGQEAMRWDGSHDRMTHYASRHEVNAEWVQLAVALSGERSSHGVYTPKGGKNCAKLDSHYVLRPHVRAAEQGRKVDYSWTTNVGRADIEWDAPVYCLSVPSSYLVVRRNRKIMMTGQCLNTPAVLRDIIIPRPGHVFVGADADQIHIRIIAAHWDVPEYKAVFELNGDPHAMTASIIYQDEFRNARGFSDGKWVDLTVGGRSVNVFVPAPGGKWDHDAKRMRSASKTEFYAWVYKASVETQHRLVTSTEDSEGNLIYKSMALDKVRWMSDRLLEGAPAIPAGWAREIALYHRQGFITEPCLGRRFDFLDGSGGSEHELQQLESKMVNSPILGAEAGWMNPATIRMIEEVPYDFDAGTGLVHQNYDSMCQEVVIDEDLRTAKHVANIMQDCMSGYADGLPGVKLTATAQVGPNLKDA